jgi:hypothetical protein
MVFTGIETTLSGMHNWTDYGGGKLKPEYEVFGPDPGCHGRISGAVSGALLLNSEEFLHWKFERICK